jgi:hypothetical protein
MVREFFYLGDRYRATVHGRPGKEEIFIVQVLEDDEEGPEISIDRFEDAENDPQASLESVLAKLVDKLVKDQLVQPSDRTATFAWSNAEGATRVHSGLQHH